MVNWGRELSRGGLVDFFERCPLARGELHRGEPSPGEPPPGARWPASHKTARRPGRARRAAADLAKTARVCSPLQVSRPTTITTSGLTPWQRADNAAFTCDFRDLSAVPADKPLGD